MPEQKAPEQMTTLDLYNELMSTGHDLFKDLERLKYRDDGKDVKVIWAGYKYAAMLMSYDESMPIIYNDTDGKHTLRVLRLTHPPFERSKNTSLRPSKHFHPIYLILNTVQPVEGNKETTCYEIAMDLERSEEDLAYLHGFEICRGIIDMNKRISFDNDLGVETISIGMVHPDRGYLYFTDGIQQNNAARNPLFPEIINIKRHISDGIGYEYLSIIENTNSLGIYLYSSNSKEILSALRGLKPYLNRNNQPVS